MKYFLSLLVFALFFTNGVQAQISHDLEIYSENGLKFKVILNGRTMNEEFVSNVQIVNTDKDYMNVKIIFEDSSIPAIEKKYLQVAEPGEGSDKAPVSVVYKIEENKKGDQNLKFASRSKKKIQDAADVIIIQSNPEPINGKIIISW